MLKNKCCKCCDNPLNLGCLSPCGVLNLGLVAAAATYTLVVTFAGQRCRIKKAFAAGDNLEFPLETLNENYCYTGFLVIENEDGSCADLELIDEFGSRFDCIKFCPELGGCYTNKLIDLIFKTVE